MLGVLRMIMGIPASAAWGRRQELPGGEQTGYLARQGREVVEELFALFPVFLY